MGVRPSVAGWLLLLYAATLVLLTQWHWSPTVSHPQIISLVPFRGVNQSLAAGELAVLINIMGNIVAFMPVGLLLALWRSSFRCAGTIGLLGSMFSASLEGSQWLQGQRVTDIDDVVLNTLGALLGYGVFRLWALWFRGRGNPATRGELA